MRIGSQEGDLLRDSLPDKEPVERIAVQHRKACNYHGMAGENRKLFKAVPVDLGRQLLQISGQLSNRTLMAISQIVAAEIKTDSALSIRSFAAGVSLGSPAVSQSKI
jgi:hypothetical protein